MPAIGIIAKLCIHIARFRRELAVEVNVYFMLVRALILFHQHQTFRADCSVALFMLAFSEFTVGSHRLSMPHLCCKLSMPIKCDTHWKLSANTKFSSLEMLLAHPESSSMDAESSWQYVRLVFASQWFDGFSNVITLCNSSPSKDFARNYGGTNDIPTLAFDNRLQLTRQDLALIKATDSHGSVKYWLNSIVNATNHSDVVQGLAGIFNQLLLVPNAFASNGVCADVMRAVSRFTATMPNTESDETVYVEVLRLLAKLVESGTWILSHFNDNFY